MRAAKGVGAMQAAQPDHGRDLRLDNGRLADVRGDDRRLGGPRANGGDRRRLAPQAHPAHGAGCAIDIPRAELALQHGGLGRQLGAQMGVEGADLAADQALAGRGPAAMAGAHQLLQHVRELAGFDAGPGRMAAAEQAGQGADRDPNRRIGHELPRRRDLNLVAGFPDEPGGHDRGVRGMAWRQIKHHAALFRRGQAVEQAGGRRAAQRRVAFQRGKRRAGQMRAGRDPTGAAGVEHDLSSVLTRILARLQRRGLLLAAVIDDSGDRVAVQPDLDGADQQQATAPGQRARVEHAAEVFGREPHWHGNRESLVAGEIGPEV